MEKAVGINELFTMSVIKVCLVVDNPLRDLEGLVLVGLELSKLNIETYLVPMYFQDFDILAINPDLVLVNYLRPNNSEVLWRFHNKGVKIAVLDTEGSPGRDVDNYASMVKNVSSAALVDLYCLWGMDQYESFIKKEVIFKDNIKVTGCPRYDFCYGGLRKSLPKQEKFDNYILINTSFPLVNPRFTKDYKEELKTMISVGYDVAFATEVVNDSLIAFNNVIESITKIAKKFSDQNIIIRPHPFEDLKAYESIEQSNIYPIQTGTSLEWIVNASVLIHLNCITSVEAIMLKKETVSLEWLNTPSLLAQSPPFNVSINAKSQNDLESIILRIISEGCYPVDDKLLMLRKNIIRKRYFKIDGKASERVAKEILDTVGLKEKSNNSLMPVFSYRVKFLYAVKKIFGFKKYFFLKRLVQGVKYDNKIAGKAFSLKSVEKVLDRINKALDGGESIKACYADKQDMKLPRYASNEVIKIYKA